MDRSATALAAPLLPDAWATGRKIVLITGFGPFPGIPVNATMRLVPELGERAAKLFPDLRIATEVLPTEWLSAPRRVAHLLDELDPHLVLHLGVSAKARGFEIEARARNACGATPDAAGAFPPWLTIREGAADFLRASVPIWHVLGRLRLRGIPAFVSRDAGNYLCNATLYNSLACAGSMRRRTVGFFHIPATLAQSKARSHGIGACPLTWTQAVEGGIEILAACLGRAAPARDSRLAGRPALTRSAGA